MRLGAREGFLEKLIPQTLSARQRHVIVSVCVSSCMCTCHVGEAVCAQIMGRKTALVYARMTIAICYH